uniref:microtubule-associated protein TORTIFOLIA1 isoform X2 n=1 Tax=Erigeron canadensis TaxID=72917 RepID=UPI001CB9C5E9|nr:microtubule-associated protein TORTIFOLIA1 isoform X2 [Erigeron canadensis]
MSTKSLRPTKPPIPHSSRSPLSSHLAIIELKQRILNSLSRLSDRDTHEIAVEDLETVIKTASSDTLSLVLNTLFESINETTTNTPPVKKEAIRLLSFICTCHTELAAAHLKKIITNIVKRLKDSDSGVKDSCCESIGQLSCLYLKGLKEKENANIGSIVLLFVKPLFDSMNEQNKSVQSGAAMCLGKMIDMASDPPVLNFQKLCTKICKFLNSPNFLANSALLPVVSSLCQVGAIAPQALDPLLQSIHDCLSSSDWTTRKAAADTLNAMALHSSNLIIEKPTATITILETCRFDKIKPVRDSITEALLLWKFIAEGHEDQKTSSPHQDSEPAKLSKNILTRVIPFTQKLSKKILPKSDDKQIETPVKDGQNSDQNVPEKTIGTKKKAPTLSDKELNPEFFQRLERRVSGEVEVVVNRRLSSYFQNEELQEVNKENDEGEKSNSKESYQLDAQVNLQARSVEKGGDGIGPSFRRREPDNNEILLGIQRQLLHMERKQAHLMKLLQDFKGGSRDGMVTLENRVWGLERVVEEMACNISSSMSAFRSSSYLNGFEDSSIRSSKYNGFSDYSNTRLGRNDNGMSYMGRGSSWGYHTHGSNSQMGSIRATNRSPIRVGPVRVGEGPSARSVWQASKDEATLEAIRGVVPKKKAEVSGNENLVQNRDPVLSAWRNAMDGVDLGDMDMAFGEVLSSGDDLLLVKLMDKTGPLIDRLSSEVASEVLHAVAQFLLEPNLFDISLSWIQQRMEQMLWTSL